jgi:hypothetical protein
MINLYDIFDILVERTVHEPTYIFDIVEIVGMRLGIQQFRETRILNVDLK